MMCADNAAMDGTRLVRLIYENRNNEGAYLNALCEAFILGLRLLFKEIQGNNGSFS